MFQKWREIALWKRILGGLTLGIILGVFLGEDAALIKPVGSLFLNAIKMLIVPLVFTSLVVGVTAMDPARMGRVGIKAFLLFLLTTAVAITIGLSLGTLIQPGVGISLGEVAAMTPKAAPSLVDTLIAMVPKNPISALASGNMLQIIVFALVLGVSINLVGGKVDPVKRFFEAAAEVMYKMTNLVMELAPFGVFALMAWVAGKYGIDILLPLLKIIIAVYLACTLHAMLTLGGLLSILGRLNPLPFFKGIIEAQVVAFTSTSSSGTLPVTMRCSQERHGVSKAVSSFVLPLGATINMDGTAIYQGVSALFVAQAFGIDLDLGQYMTIVATATLASIGTAGVPGAGLITLSLVLTSVGLPLEGIAIIAGIDRILDMARTTVNITGDAMVTLITAKSEGELDEAVYYGEAPTVEVSVKPDPVSS